MIGISRFLTLNTNELKINLRDVQKRGQLLRKKVQKGEFSFDII